MSSHLFHFCFEDLNMPKEKLHELFTIDKKFWQEEAAEIKEYLNENVCDSTPTEILHQLDLLNERINSTPDWEFI